MDLETRVVVRLNLSPAAREVGRGRLRPPSIGPEPGSLDSPTGAIAAAGKRWSTSRIRERQRESQFRFLSGLHEGRSSPGSPAFGTASGNDSNVDAVESGRRLAAFGWFEACTRTVREIHKNATMKPSKLTWPQDRAICKGASALAKL
jgi:hypothetical protein